jgi:hypothetical protein
MVTSVIDDMAEREGFEPSLFSNFSIPCKAIVSRSCLAQAENALRLAASQDYTILYKILQNCREISSMTTTTQVSAYISEETKAEIEAYVKRRGVKKAYLIEEALLHHLQALREIPEDLVIPSRLVLTREAMTEIAERIDGKGEPTEGLKALFRE